MVNVIVVLIILALALLSGWRLLAEKNRDQNRLIERNTPDAGDAELRCFFCSGDAKWCRCRDELPTAK